jgi:Luciferase-like monooxygenase
MSLGLSIASHSGLPPARVGALAEAAERAGFDAVFVAEGHGDALSLCHPVAAATRRVRVGTAVANAALRPPVLAAKTAAQLDQATDGRFILGLGVANTVMNTRFGLAPFGPRGAVRPVTAPSHGPPSPAAPPVPHTPPAPPVARIYARRPPAHDIDAPSMSHGQHGCSIDFVSGRAESRPPG